MKALLTLFSLLLLVLIVGLWVGPGSYPDRWRLEERTVKQAEENKQKQQEIAKIQAELNDASSSQEALEERARSELGMTKKGETFFEVIMQPDSQKPEHKVIEPQDSSNTTPNNNAQTVNE